jgi:hypothetical protein
MRTSIIVGFIGFSLATLAAQSSHATIVSANWDIKNDNSQPAFDFHVVVVQPTTAPTNWVDGAFKHHNPTPLEALHRTVLDWDDGTVPAKGSTHLGVEFDSDAGEAKAHDVWWTNKDGSQLCEKLFFPDFEAHALFDNAEFSVIDDTDQSLVFHNLQFQTRPSHTPLDQLIPYTLPGFGASVPDFTLLPGQSMAFDIEDGADNFVLAQMITYDPSNPTASPVGTVFQVGMLVPEPTTWAMMLVGFSGLGFMGLRRARSEVRRRAAG